VWVEIAVVTSLFAVGSILFGHFEEGTPKWRRVFKLVLTIGIVVGISATIGRAWGFAFLVLPLTAALVIHVWWLPKHGINGWTGEPKDKYYELRGWKTGQGSGTPAASR
jgi:quinol-cytochrome oxidoreductase complex cytochrome b subunit